MRGRTALASPPSFRRLCARVEQDGHPPSSRLVFPQYHEPSSALIRMYLGGEFGSRPRGCESLRRLRFLCGGPVRLFEKSMGGILFPGRADRSPTATLPPMPSTRGPSAPLRSAPPFWAGWTILSTASWACPGPTWSSIWICLPAVPGAAPQPGGSHPHSGGHPRGGSRLSGRLPGQRPPGCPAPGLAGHPLRHGGRPPAHGGGDPPGGVVPGLPPVESELRRSSPWFIFSWPKALKRPRP